MQFEQRTTVNVPLQKAFDYLADVAHHSEWASHGLQVEKATQGPIAVGTTFNTVGHLMGTHRAQVTITELVPGQKIVFESRDDTGHFRHYFNLQPKDGSTEVVKGVQPLETSLMFKLMLPMVPLIFPRGLKADLGKIKSHLEA